MLAEEIGIGHTTVRRVWKEHRLEPHLTRPFELSNDPEFAEKSSTLSALPRSTDKAVILCVDEKSRFERSIVRNQACR